MQNSISEGKDHNESEQDESPAARNGRNGKIHGDDLDIGDMYSDDPNTKCGFGSFHPDCLQAFARIGAFVGIYSISGLLTSSLSVYVNSQVSMLEKQFGFSSAEAGVLMSCNDIGYLSVALFCGYFASKVHIPRVLGLSTILFGICGIMCALPYFLQEKSTYDVNPLSPNATVSGGRRKVPMCDVTNISLSESGCSSSTSNEAAFNIEELRVKRVAYWLIAIGMVFQGVGKSVRNPFVTLYIDDAVDKRKTGFYMGIIIGTSIFGPALAYLLGGVFSKIYVTLKPVDITPNDPRWIGAWWLGFLGFGACAILFSVPLMCFPRKLKSRSRRNAEMGEVAMPTKQETNRSFFMAIFAEIKGFILAMFRILKNPVYTTLALSNCASIIGVSGMLAFMPKYFASQYSIPLWKANIILATNDTGVIQLHQLIGVSGMLAFMPKYFASQYSIPLWKANIILALSSITAVSIGSFVGGILTRRVNMTPMTTCKLLAMFYFGNIVFQLTGLVLGCEQPVLYGDKSYSTHPELYTATNTTCLQGCQCSDEKHFPICGENGLDFYSPCHAGCLEKEGAMGFANCTCIPGGHARAGLCDQGCSTNLYIYAAFTFIGKFVAALKIIPGFIATIRCVDESDRAVATATFSFLTSTLGWMPGPVIFGLVIDNTCLLWKYTCGERQSCQLYDIHYFRNAIHGYVTTANAIAMLALIGLYFYFRVRGVQTWRSNAPGPNKVKPDEHSDKNTEMHSFNEDSKSNQTGDG